MIEVVANNSLPGTETSLQLLVSWPDLPVLRHLNLAISVEHFLIVWKIEIYAIPYGDVVQDSTGNNYIGNIAWFAHKVASTGIQTTEPLLPDANSSFNCAPCTGMSHIIRSLCRISWRQKRRHDIVTLCISEIGPLTKY